MLRFAPGRACFLVRFGVRQWMPRRRQRLANRVEDGTGSFPCLFATGCFHSPSPVRTMGCYSGRQILSTFATVGQAFLPVILLDRIEVAQTSFCGAARENTSDRQECLSYPEIR